jgi:hypothetical protein
VNRGTRDNLFSTRSGREWATAVIREERYSSGDDVVHGTHNDDLTGLNKTMNRPALL